MPGLPAWGSTHCHPARGRPHVVEWSIGLFKAASVLSRLLGKVVSELGGAVAGAVAQDWSSGTTSSWGHALEKNKAEGGDTST